MFDHAPTEATSRLRRNGKESVNLYLGFGRSQDRLGFDQGMMFDLFLVFHLSFRN